MAMLVIYESLQLFVNTFIAHDKYSLCNIENMPQPIQTKLCKKQKKKCDFFAPFLKSTSHFKHFEDKYDSHSLYISEIMDCERRG